jgi:hypothetical protein
MKMSNLRQPTHLLIMTSTVHVNSDMTVLTDPAIREQQYVDSILYYLRSPYMGAVIVCDNSGFDFSLNRRLTEALAASGKRAEFLHFRAETDKIEEKGKGYGEGQILAHVFRESRLLRDSESSVFKVTGRLLVLNFDTIAQKVKPDKTYFQRVGRNPFVNLKKVDTRFYYCNKEIFEAWLMTAFRSVNDREGHYLEHTYYQVLKERHIRYSGFGIPPLFSGVSGSTGLSYAIGPVKRVAEKLINYLSGNRF